MIHESLKIWSGDSINGGSAGGLYGRFSPNTRSDTITLEETDFGNWFVGLPFGSCLTVGTNQEDEVRERFEQICESARSNEGFDQNRWYANKDKADEESRRKAIRRHNQNCERPTYVAKFGQMILE